MNSSQSIRAAAVRVSGDDQVQRPPSIVMDARNSEANGGTQALDKRKAAPNSADQIFAAKAYEHLAKLSPEQARKLVCLLYDVNVNTTTIQSFEDTSVRAAYLWLASLYNNHRSLFFYSGPTKRYQVAVAYLRLIANNQAGVISAHGRGCFGLFRRYYELRFQSVKSQAPELAVSAAARSSLEQSSRRSLSGEEEPVFMRRSLRNSVEVAYSEDAHNRLAAVSGSLPACQGLAQMRKQIEHKYLLLTSMLSCRWQLMAAPTFLSINKFCEIQKWVFEAKMLCSTEANLAEPEQIWRLSQEMSGLLEQANRLEALLPRPSRIIGELSLFTKKTTLEYRVKDLEIECGKLSRYYSEFDWQNLPALREINDCWPLIYDCNNIDNSSTNLQDYQLAFIYDFAYNLVIQQLTRIRIIQHVTKNGAKNQIHEYLGYDTLNLKNEMMKVVPSMQQKLYELVELNNLAHNFSEEHVRIRMRNFLRRGWKTLLATESQDPNAARHLQFLEELYDLNYSFAVEERYYPVKGKLLAPDMSNSEIVDRFQGYANLNLKRYKDRHGTDVQIQAAINAEIEEYNRNFLRAYREPQRSNLYNLNNYWKLSPESLSQGLEFPPFKAHFCAVMNELLVADFQQKARNELSYDLNRLEYQMCAMLHKSWIEQLAVKPKLKIDIQQSIQDFLQQFEAAHQLLFKEIRRKNNYLDEVYAGREVATESIHNLIDYVS